MQKEFAYDEHMMEEDKEDLTSTFMADDAEEEVEESEDEDETKKEEIEGEEEEI